MNRRRSFGPAEGSPGFLTRFARARSGAVAIWFAVMALPLAVLSFALIDINRASVEKRHLQDALDAAVLLVARSTATTDTQAQSIGAAALSAQLTGMTQATLQSSSFKIVGSVVKGTATATVSPYIANLWLGGDMKIDALAEATRASTNLEVAMVLDITGSMAGTKITDLKAAAKSLVDLVVQDVQTPYYSKVALVPFSLGVNAGSYAASARGTPTPPASITGASWSTGLPKLITGANKAGTVTITSAAHGLQNGDIVWISGVLGMTQLNNKAYTVSNRAANTFRLSGVSSSSYSTYLSGGTITKCQVANCAVVVSANAHGLTDGASVLIKDILGITQLNNNTYTVANAAANSFALSGTQGPLLSIYLSGGKAHCLTLGCQYYRLTRDDGNLDNFEITNCVSERIGTGAYTDLSPSSNPVGRIYMRDTTDCPSSTITPLSSDKATLKSTIDSYVATGATAGQIGAAWGWYLVSPNFATMFPTASQPAVYGKKDLLKVVVFMTDGDFNTAYCNNVLSKESNGYNSDQINCNATNGDPTAQAQKVCTNMKAQGIVVYTVGFQISKGSTAETLIKNCATSSAHVYLPSGGGALKDAFSAIGQDIMKLRLSK